MKNWVIDPLTSAERWPVYFKPAASFLGSRSWVLTAGFLFIGHFSGVHSSCCLTLEREASYETALCSSSDPYFTWMLTLFPKRMCLGRCRQAWIMTLYKKNRTNSLWCHPQDSERGSKDDLSGPDCAELRLIQEWRNDGSEEVCLHLTSLTTS